MGKMGKIVKIYKDGDLRVTIEGQTWTLNPNCVELVAVCVNTNTPSPRHNEGIHFFTRFELYLIAIFTLLLYSNFDSWF